MALITSIQDIFPFIKVNVSNASASLPNQERAENRFLIPILGQAVYDDLVANLADSNYETLFKKCCYVVAPLSYLLELPTIQSMITENGIKTFENDNQRAAHRWEYEELKHQLEDDGSYAIEDLLKYLFENATQFSWEIPVAYKLIFQKAEDFALYAPLHQPYRTFESLRVVIRQIEDQYMRPTIGDDFFDALRDAASPSTEEAAAIKLLKKAVANLTIARAIETLGVEFNRDGFTVLLSPATEKPAQGQQNAPNNQLRMAYERAQSTGESYLLQLKEYLNENASPTVFATYYASDLYNAPPADGENEDSPNAGRTGVYGF